MGEEDGFAAVVHHRLPSRIAAANDITEARRLRGGGYSFDKSEGKGCIPACQSTAEAFRCACEFPPELPIAKGLKPALQLQASNPSAEALVRSESTKS